MFDFLFNNQIYSIFSNPKNFLKENGKPNQRNFNQNRPSREKFNSYPKYLKLSLFIEQEVFTKIRGTEITQRYLSLEEFRERGNECVFKKQFKDALIFYTQAHSILRWLEYTDPSEAKKRDSLDESTKDIDENDMEAG